MTKPGHIRIGIDQKVYFEYYKLDKPNKKIYEKAKVYNFENLIIQKYEASKQLIEVSNWITIDTVDKNCSLLLSEIPYISKYVWDGEPCKAKITNNTATIVD